MSIFKEEDIIFTKVGNRYELSPEDRILFVLENVDEINPTKLMRITNVGYLQLQNIIEDLAKRKILKVDTQIFNDNKIVNKSIKIKMVKQKEKK